MANIELVIKIHEEMYKWVNDANKIFDDYGISDFIDLVKNGTPLPKGHKRLIEDNFDAGQVFDTRGNLVGYRYITQEDLANAWIDEYGVMYSADRKRLLKAFSGIKEYTH